LYCRTTTAAAQTAKNARVALAESSAALVSFQRHQPGFPPHKMADSAVSPVLPARHFSGLSAKIVQFENL